MDQGNPQDQNSNVREREVIVTDSGRGGPGIGGVVAAVIGAIVVLLLAWMLFFNGGGDGEGGENPLPNDVNVDVNGPEGGGGDGEG